MNPSCKICQSITQSFEHPKLQKQYHHCQTCDFIFLDEKYYISKDAEKKQYEQHHNSLENQGYVEMFERFIHFIHAHTGKEQLKCLDFGSGPGPVLSYLLKKHGHETAIFDPNFAPDPKVLTQQYELITSTEVIEHLHHPVQTLKELLKSSVPHGYLAIMTQFHPQNTEEFCSWWYPRDPTHVSFFSTKTLPFLAKALELYTIDHDEKSHALFQTSKNAL